jgi:hypothetical protein
MLCVIVFFIIDFLNIFSFCVMLCNFILCRVILCYDLC